MSEYQKLLDDVIADLETANGVISECEQLVGTLEKRAGDATGDKAAAYKTVITDLHESAESAKAQITELQSVKRFVESRLNGKPSGPPAPKSEEKSSRPAPKRETPPPITPPKPVAPTPAPEASMNTVEFGPDGFPIG